MQRVDCLGPFLRPVCERFPKRVATSRGKARVRTSFTQTGNLVNKLGKKANIPVGRGTLAMLSAFQIPGFPNGERLKRSFHSPPPNLAVFVGAWLRKTTLSLDFVSVGINWLQVNRAR